MSVIIDGTGGVTFPNSTVQASSSKVLQTVSTVTSTLFSTANTTPTSSGISLSITPLFSTSKILVNVTSGAFYINVGGQAGYATVYRNSTNLASTYLSQVYGASAPMTATTSINYLDSPATTSSTTYTLYVYTSGNSSTVYVNSGGGSTTITLMEIAA